MDFDKSWLQEGGDPPEEHRAEVARLLDFADGEADQEMARALGEEALEALEALVALLTERRDGTRLALLREATLPKKQRKLVGKAIHRLRTLGVVCEAPSGRVGVMGYHSVTLPSWMALPIATGVRLLILSGKDSQNRPLSCYAVTDETGFDDLAAIEEPSKSQIRKLITSIEDPNDLGVELFFAETDERLVRTRLVQALERHKAGGKAAPRELSVCRILLDGPLLEPGEHPVYDLLPEVDPLLVRRGHELLGRMVGDQYRQGPCDRPVLTDEWEVEASQRLQNAMMSPVVIDSAQRRERVHDEVDRLVTELFTTEIRIASAERLEDGAYVLCRAGREEEGALALATAVALRDPTRGALDIPWARESIHGIVDVEAMLAQADLDEQSPAELPDDEPARTDGGLIIPG